MSDNLLLISTKINTICNFHRFIQIMMSLK